MVHLQEDILSIYKKTSCLKGSSPWPSATRIALAKGRVLPLQPPPPALPRATQGAGEPKGFSEGKGFNVFRLGFKVEDLGSAVKGQAFRNKGLGFKI